jgi:hypothetical protein
MRRALTAILAFSVFGAVASGVLSYPYLVGVSAANPSGALGSTAGYSLGVSAVFFTYFLVAATAVWGLISERQERLKSAASDHHSERLPPALRARAKVISLLEWKAQKCDMNRSRAPTLSRRSRISLRLVPP